MPVIPPGLSYWMAHITVECQHLQKILENYSDIFIFCRWLPKETEESRESYIRALSESDLSLNPVGMNTECYRIYEALSLGSVPVVEDVMTPGNCGGPAQTPLRLLKQYKAPLIYVSNWTNVADLLEREHQRPLRDAAARRDGVLRWYTDFRAKMKERFVNVLKRKFFGETS